MDKAEKQELEAYSSAMELVLGSVLPMTMQSAIELGIFEILSKAENGVGKLSASQIVGQMSNCKNSNAAVMVDRILMLLASHGVVDCCVVGGERLYSLNPVSKYFVLNKDGFSLSSTLVFIQDAVLMKSWSQLKDVVLEGGGSPFERAHGMHVFEYPRFDPRFNEALNTAMINHTTIIISKVLQHYKGFKELKQLVDVGGGLGAALNAIISKYPHIKGINFDLPHVVQHAPAYPGIEHVAGDMFTSVPKGDAIFMKWILHDWSDEHCLKLLKNCYNAIPNDGKVIVMDRIISVMPETILEVKNTCKMDVLLLAQVPGGKKRTQEEFTTLATGAGFSGIRVIFAISNLWVMEFFK